MFTTNDNEQMQALMAQSPENKELIQKLLDAHRFTLSKISHEIRNPLTLVYSTLQLIESQHPEARTFNHWTQLIEDVEFMNQLLDELSVYNNGQSISPKLFDFQDFLKHLAISFATTLVDTNIEFTSQISSSLTQITGDRTKLQEVFLNLLRNAKDAVSANGKITLKAYPQGESVLITVEDDGCGIPEHLIDTIFAPFTTYKSGGSGLGLAIVQKTVLAHNGDLKVASSELGTTFTITLPIEQYSQ